MQNLKSVIFEILSHTGTPQKQSTTTTPPTPTTPTMLGKYRGDEITFEIGDILLAAQLTVQIVLQQNQSEMGGA